MTQSSTLRPSCTGRARAGRLGVVLVGAGLAVAVAGAQSAFAGGPRTGHAGPGKTPRAIAYGYGNQIVTLPPTQVFTPPQQIFTPPTVTPPKRPEPIQVFAPPSVQRGTLPFTGIQLTVFMVIGLALVLGGALLRRSQRRTPELTAGGAVGYGTSLPGSPDPLEVRRRLALEAARLGGLAGGRRSRSS